MFEHGRHARLLQHDFAEPDAVGIASSAPRKVAVMQVIPAQKGAAKGRLIFAGLAEGMLRRVSVGTDGSSYTLLV